MSRKTTNTMNGASADRRELPSLAIKFDRNLIWHRGNSVRYLIADITAPPAKAEAAHSKGLNLALVIDASGSMRGMPLEAAKRAASGVVERLGPGDRLSVVSFASDVITHVRSRAMDEPGRTEALEAIGSLGVRGMTSLSSGWLAGAEWVAQDMEERTGCRNQVLVLSDGHANEGIVETGQLSEIASGLRDRGLLTSTVGIGDGYSPAQLQAIAESGGGRMHDAERPEEIIEVVLAELAELHATVVENVVLEVELPAAAGGQVRVEVLGSFPLEVRGSVALCSVGSLIGSASRRIVLKVTTPAGAVGEALGFSARLRWREPGSDQLQTGRARGVTLRFASGSENSGQERDVAGSVEVARLWQSVIVRQAVAVNRNSGGRGDTAKRLMVEMKHFERYCQGLPGTEPLLDQLRRTLAAIHRPWHERSRKEMELAHYKRQRHEPDLRARARPAWDSYLPGQG